MGIQEAHAHRGVVDHSLPRHRLPGSPHLHWKVLLIDKHGCPGGPSQAAQKAIHAPTQDGLPGSPCLDWEFLLINKQRSRHVEGKKADRKQRAQKVVVGNAATEAHMVDNEDEVVEVDEQAKGCGGKGAAGKKKKATKMKCHAHVVKGTHICWECKHRHLWCGAGEGINILIHGILRKMTTELFNLSIANMCTAIAIKCIEENIDDLTAMMKVVMEAIRGVEAMEVQRGWIRDGTFFELG
ncbi:hypothetical protein BDN71DRAFT_1432922 [Pleurotus eryngii]|uniref:Uncharacterized protein n=1 Tax=Pleurotus eryngii TaxID=5323 RepID=A0A9P6DEU3_PLEER|nr:hypothetical protein BDN71DRAFT_1432922 [Pleurotus eryngii]